MDNGKEADRMTLEGIRSAAVVYWMDGYSKRGLLKDAWLRMLLS